MKTKMILKRDPESYGQGTIHVVPRDDVQEHLSSVKCWCKPDQDTQAPNLYIHHRQVQH